MFSACQVQKEIHSTYNFFYILVLLLAWIFTLVSLRFIVFRLVIRKLHLMDTCFRMCLLCMLIYLPYMYSCLSMIVYPQWKVCNNFSRRNVQVSRGNMQNNNYQDTSYRRGKDRLRWRRHIKLCAIIKLEIFRAPESYYLGYVNHQNGKYYSINSVPLSPQIHQETYNTKTFS